MRRAPRIGRLIPVCTGCGSPHVEDEQRLLCLDCLLCWVCCHPLHEHDVEPDPATFATGPHCDGCPSCTRERGIMSTHATQGGNNG